MLVKAKYISRKKVGDKWVYDYGDKKGSKGKKVESEGDKININKDIDKLKKQGFKGYVAKDPGESIALFEQKGNKVVKTRIGKENIVSRIKELKKEFNKESDPFKRLYS